MKRVILIHFSEEAKNYQAFSQIKKMVLSGSFKGEQMAVLSHLDRKENPFVIEDFIDFTGKNKSSKGSMIGLLIGVLGGLPGMLLGWLTGSIIGSVQDVKEVSNAKTIFDHLNDQIPKGESGLVLIAEEEDNRILNQLITYELNGQITRLSYEEVEAEIKKVQEKQKE